MFADTESLSRDLEKGIGAVEPAFRPFSESMRLRMPGPCGIASLAIQHHLMDQGIESDLVLSQPGIPADPDYTHAFLIAEIDKKPVVIDPTYSQLLYLAGMSEGYIHYGGTDRFPDEKIVAFPLGEQDNVAHALAAVAKVCIDMYEPIQNPYYNNHLQFKGLSEAEIEHQISQFWHEDNLELLRLAPYYEERGLELAEHIDPAHAQIVA